jgi:hypothetical protein
MKETTKTISFIAVAVAVLLLAWVSQPAAPPVITDKLIGKSLFPSLDDPLKVKRMRVVTFDESTSQARDFEVAQTGGSWSLPSHKNYPADAKDQIAAAVSALVDLKVLAPVSSDARDHELYGVVEPKPAEDQFGQKGVGKLVVMEDDSGKALARLIIGKEDKTVGANDMAPTDSQLRFVRVPGQDQVYRVSMRADKFSTNFADWIETDLLKLNPWDISDIKLHDYSVTEKLGSQGDVEPVLVPRADIDLTFDDKTNKWSVKELQEYKDGKPKEEKLTDDEELNTAKLNDLKSALGSLKIMDVARKPPQLSADLKTEKGEIHDEAMADLAQRGFLPAMMNKQFQIVSNDGEAIVSMKDGVQYVLRFGDVAGIDSGADDGKKKTDADGKKTGAADKKTDAKADNSSTVDAGDKTEKHGGLSRYIMVMAQFNPNLLPKPDLQPLPEIKKAPEKTTTSAKAETSKSGEAPAKKASDTKSADAKSADSKASNAKSNAKKDSDKIASATKDDSDDQEAQEEERDRIEKENKRKQDEYDDKVKKGQQRARELNARFADWYYVVGDETYRKIHLGQADIIKKKVSDEAKNAAHAAGASTPKDPFQIPGLPIPGQK